MRMRDMKRRDFAKSLAGGVGVVIGAGVAQSVTPASAQPARASRKNTVMHVGADYHSVAGTGGLTSKQNLEYNLRFGVKHLMPQVRKVAQDGAWDLDELKTMKDNCDKFGVDIDPEILELVLELPLVGMLNLRRRSRQHVLVRRANILLRRHIILLLDAAHHESRRRYVS